MHPLPTGALLPAGGFYGAALPPRAFEQGLPRRGMANPALKLAAVILTTYADN